MREYSLLLLLQLLQASLTASGAAQLADALRTSGGLNLTGRSLGQGLQSVQLNLCDCEPATGSPNGLTCEKEGWFVSSFEREGSWQAGGGYVPLSAAICCRPCLPSKLPPDPSGVIDPKDKPVAIVSIGCHPSSGTGPDSLRCEANGGSFVTGFQKALRVSPNIDVYYPVGNVQCCTPSVLLESGDAWELERCDCLDSADINCGTTVSHTLLQGFESWRMTRMGEFVPIAPARCCRACLGDKIHPMDVCYDLNYCSGHGVCTLGACECTNGFSGPDCSHQAGALAGGLPQWAVTLITLSSCAALSIVMIVVSRFVRYYRFSGSDDADSNEGEQLREPFTLRIDSDDNGSVGSEDTTDCDDSASDECTEPDADHTPVVGGGERIPEYAAAALARLPSDRRRRRRSQLRGQQTAAAGSETEPPPAGAPAVADAGTATGGIAHVRTEPAAAAAVGRGGGGVNGEGPENGAAEQPGTPYVLSSADAAAVPLETRRVHQQVAGGQPIAEESALPEEPAAGEVGDRQQRREAVDEARVVTVQLRRPGDEIQVVGDSDVSDADNDDHLLALQLQEQADAGKDGDVEGKPTRSLEGFPALSSVECSVCMSRPVQVVVIPCGHACMCRRCSRRLLRCPICRKEILRRQRLFIGG